MRQCWKAEDSQVGSGSSVSSRFREARTRAMAVRSREDVFRVWREDVYEMRESPFQVIV